MNNKDFTYDDLKQMKKGKDAFFVYLYPHTEHKIGVRVLTQNEMMECISQGRKKCESEMFKPVKSDYDDYQTREIIYKAVVHASDGQTPFFPSPEEAGNEDIIVLTRLLEYYQEVQEKANPTMQLETEGEFNNLIEAVKKNSPLGMSLSIDMLRKLLLFMVEKYWTSPKDSGSSSTSSNESQSSSKLRLSEELEQNKSKTPQTNVEVTSRVKSS